MAKDNSGPATDATKAPMSEQMRKAQATRAARKKDMPILDQSEKYALQLVRNARKACEIAADRIQHRKHVSSEVLQACTTLAGQASTMLHD